MNIKLIAAIPTWCLITVCSPFYNDFVNLKNWYEERNKFCKFIDVALWALTINFIVIMFIIFW